MQVNRVRTQSWIQASTQSSKIHLTRRQTLQGTAITIASSFLPPAAQGGSKGAFESYTDPAKSLSLSYPASWISLEGTAENADYVNNRLKAWHPEGVSPNDVNVTLIVTNASADFTKLGSFGSAENFGANLVNSMDRSYMKRAIGRRPEDVQTARLLDAKSVNGMYRIEYLLKKPQDQEKHFISLTALRFDGVYNRLYTLTGQCYEKEFAEYESEIQTFLESFKPPGEP